MKSILERNLNKFVALISKDNPWNMIFGKVISVDDNFVKLENALWYGRDHIYFIIALLSGMFKNYLEVFLRTIKDPKHVFEIDIKKYVDTLMQSISDRVISSVNPEIIPLFILKKISTSKIEYFIPYKDLIVVEIDNGFDSELINMLTNQISILYGGDKVNNSNVVINKEGNA